MINYQQLQSEHIESINRYSQENTNNNKRFEELHLETENNIKQLIELLNSPFYYFLFRDTIIKNVNELYSKINEAFKELGYLSLNIECNIRRIKNLIPLLEKKEFNQKLYKSDIENVKKNIENTQKPEITLQESPKYQFKYKIYADIIECICILIISTFVSLFIVYLLYNIFM